MDSANLLSNSEIRKGAREKLKGNWGTTILAFIIFLLILVPISLLPFIGVISNIILSGAFTLGFAILFLNLVRSGKAKFGDLFKGFNNFGKALLAYLLRSLFILLWGLLLIIPGIIAAIKYSQTFYILADNPNMKAIDAIRESKRMMEGNKWKYFKLQLSFIGWALLSILTLGIGYLWLAQYMYASYALFYEDLKGNKFELEENTVSNVSSPIQEL